VTSSLLLGACSICGELILRHRRPDGRQISCAELARIDEQLRQSGTQSAVQPIRQFQIISSGRDRDRQVLTHDGSVAR